MMQDAKQSNIVHDSSLAATTSTVTSQDGNNSNNVALQDRNKGLSEQLLRSLESYRALKTKFKSSKEESSRFRATVGKEAAAGLARIRSLKVRMDRKADGSVSIDGEICALEQIFEQFVVKVSEDQTANRRDDEHGC